MLFFVSCNKKKVDINLIDKNSVKLSNSTNSERYSGIFYCSKCSTPLYKAENNYQSMKDDESFDKAIDDKVIFNKNFENKTLIVMIGFILGSVTKIIPDNNRDQEIIGIYDFFISDMSLVFWAFLA